MLCDKGIDVTDCSHCKLMMDQNSERIRLMVNLNGNLFSLVTIKDNPNFCFLEIEILRGRGREGVDEVFLSPFV